MFFPPEQSDTQDDLIRPRRPSHSPFCGLDPLMETATPQNHITKAGTKVA